MTASRLTFISPVFQVLLTSFVWLCFNSKICAQTIDTSYRSVSQVVGPALEPKPLTLNESGKAFGGKITDLVAYRGIKNRLWFVAGAHVAGWTASYIALDKAWYADYPRQSFHFFNDNREWNQMDKAGHTWTTYQVSRVSAGLWRWAGLNHKTSTWLGGLSGMAYQSIIEIQDGFSAEWGFSWGDMAANTLGAAAFVAQELAWKEQRIQIKLSYWPYDYTGNELTARRNQLFGSSLPERILKDYNSQTYWVSANLHSFWKESSLPEWLNVAVGYSSDGMLGGFANVWTDKQGNAFNRSDIPRVRRFFLSPDIDLTRIHSRRKWVRTLLSVANMVKIPAPAIELNSKGRVQLHAVYF